ncbi:MAG: redoxin domain-containing protein [Thermoleophilia bacterium]
MSVAVGQAAPDFTLNGQDGEPVQLSSLRGTPVVLAFFPLAFSGVCTDQFGGLGEGAGAYGGDSARVLAVSVDHTHSQREFGKAIGADGVTFLSDFQPRGAVATEYGVFNDERGFSNRAVFIIDGEGVIRDIQIPASNLEMPDPGDVKAAVSACAL